MNKSSIIIDYEYYLKNNPKSKFNKGQNALIIFLKSDDDIVFPEVVEQAKEFLFFSYNLKDKISFIHDDVINKNTLDLFLDDLLKTFPSSCVIEVEFKTELNDYSLYTDKGFKNPYFKNNSLYLQRYNNYISPKEIKSVSTINKIQCVLETKSNEFCPVNFKFDIDTAKHLTKLVSHVNVLDNGKIKQKEIAGCFKVSHFTRTKDENIVAVLEITKQDMIFGDDQDVDIITNCKYTFHTHPKEAYKNNGVKLAWPSANDYKAFLYSIIYGKEGFHSVITIEGIYIISIKPNELKKIQSYNDSQKTEYYNKNSKLMNKIYDIPYPRTGSNNKGKFSDSTSYCNYIVNNKENHIFDVKFLSWKQIYSGNSFTCILTKVNNNCVFEEL
jgi:hypothetical protein